MAGPELDPTIQSFPPYADLTQTQGWAAPVGRIQADTNQAAEAASVSQSSRYREGALLGTGGMGKVVLARDARIGRDVALKVLHAERELDPDDRARFLREAQVQGQLEHPSIVPVYDIEKRPDGTTFFTMRRVLGRTLAAILDDLRTGVPASKARYTQRELLTAFGTVCLAIDYAHSRGVVHRDLKPANLMLGDFGEVDVLDWGLARLVDDAGDTVEEPHARLSMPGAFLGTPMYMAPEQMADPDVGPRADVYSLGLILFEILTLERCRDPHSLYEPVEARPSVRTPSRNIAPELETICVTATSPDPKERYASPRAMQEAIARFLEGDREVEQRRQLASQHVKAAREALGKATQSSADEERDRGVAMSELARAVALDPGNGEHVAMLADIMATPPRRVPEAVKAQFESERQRIVHMGARQALFSMVLWVFTLPALFAIGWHDPIQVVWIAIPVALTMILSALALRQRSTSLVLQYANITAVMVAGAMVSRIYGPHVLVPTLITANAVVLQTHPDRSMRRFSVTVGVASLLLPVALEWLGAWPRSYRFDAGGWQIVPQLLNLPPAATFVYVAVAGVLSLVVASGFIARLRADLTDAQVKLAVQAWHFRRLGAQLIGERL